MWTLAIGLLDEPSELFAKKAFQKDWNKKKSLNYPHHMLIFYDPF